MENLNLIFISSFLVLLLIISVVLTILFSFNLIAFIFEIFYYFKTKTPFGRSNIKLVKEFFDTLDLKDKIFIDLGSGNGMIIFEAAKRGAKSIGYEINVFLYVVSLLKAKILKIKNVEILREDFRKANLSQADFLYLYLTPRVLREIENFIFENSKKGCQIITFDFRFPNIQPKYIFKNRIYIYEK